MKDQQPLVGSSNNTLSLNLNDVLELSDTSDTVNVIGQTGDTVTSVAQGWQIDAGAPLLLGGHLYHSYTAGTSHLLIETDLTQTIS